MNSLAYIRNIASAVALACVPTYMARAAQVPDAPAAGADTVKVVIVDDLVIKSAPVAESQPHEDPETAAEALAVGPPEAPKLDAEAATGVRDTIAVISGYPRTIYASPASWTYSDPWWHGMWIDTAILCGAYISTLFVLEILPEDATTWNRAELRKDPFYKRWFKNVFKRGPEWDHDNPIFNYVLHPYAGAAYFMCARTNGFNFWQSMLYSAAISTIGWEFGIEACMERPSIQDIFVTPLVGSILGEGFYRAKRLIVDNNYELLGTPVLGHIAAFFLDPVNEVVGLLSPGTCRNIGPGCISSQPLLIPNPAPGLSPAFGIGVTATF